MGNMSTLPNSANVLDFLVEATKEQSKLRLAVSGPSGSGKTFSSINILMALGCENIAVLDTEHGSAAKYADEFPRKFKVIDNTYWQSNFDPRRLIAVLKTLGPKVDGIVCDSLTHFWMGTGGMLSLVDAAAKRGQAKFGKYDSFGAWKEVDPIYNELVQTILALPCHFAACLRAKSEYEDQKDAGGKNKKVKVGMQSQMREGFEYEFDVEGMMTMNHDFIVGKTRCRALDELIIPKPGENIAKPLLAWLTSGVIKVEPAKVETPLVEVEAPATEPHIPAAAIDTVGAFVAQIESSATQSDLKAVAQEIKAALADKQITQGDHEKLSKVYADRNRALKASA